MDLILRGGGGGGGGPTTATTSSPTSTDILTSPLLLENDTIITTTATTTTTTEHTTTPTPILLDNTNSSSVTPTLAEKHTEDNSSKVASVSSSLVLSSSNESNTAASLIKEPTKASRNFDDLFREDQLLTNYDSNVTSIPIPEEEDMSTTTHNMATATNCTTKNTVSPLTLSLIGQTTITKKIHSKSKGRIRPVLTTKKSIPPRK
jgi:hypothetical protein